MKQQALLTDNYYHINAIKIHDNSDNPQVNSLALDHENIQGVLTSVD